MIFILLGTYPTSFERPLVQIDRLCKEGIIQEKIIVQTGYTKYESEFFEIRPFIPLEELIELYKQARLVISHAGTGSLIKGLKLKKKIIAIPRLAKYGEVVDDHQVEILNKFASLNYILPWTEDVPLETLLNKVDNFEPCPYVSNKQKIVDYLEEYINSI